MDGTNGGPMSPVSTTSVATLSTESHNPRVPAKTILDDIEHRFGKAKSKADVIRALEKCTYLHRIPLPPPNVTLEQAEKDFCRERVLLNDVAFVPDRYDVDRAHAFALTLRMLLRRLSAVTGVFDEHLYNDSSHICDLVMQRACRTSAGADSFFSVQKMLCVEGTFVTQKTLVDDPPIHIDVFLSQPPQPHLHNQQTSTESHADVRRRSRSMTSRPTSISRQTPSLSAPPPLVPTNHTNHSNTNTSQAAFHSSIADSQPQSLSSLCARVQVSNSFAIYDVSAMDLLGETDDFFSEQDDQQQNSSNTNNNNGNSGRERSQSSLAPLPWLDVESVVIDESNFRTGRHWRRLHLLVTCPATGQTFSSDRLLQLSPGKRRPLSLSLNSNNNHNNSNYNSMNTEVDGVHSPCNSNNSNHNYHHNNYAGFTEGEDDLDFCDDDLDQYDSYYNSDGYEQRRHRLSSRRVFRELAQWLAASSAGLRLSSGQRSQTQQTQQTNSHRSLPLSPQPTTTNTVVQTNNNYTNNHTTNGAQITESSNNINTDNAKLNTDTGNNISTDIDRRPSLSGSIGTVIDISTRHLPSLPYHSSISQQQQQAESKT